MGEMTVAPQWETIELTFEGPQVDNQYVDVEAWIEFRNEEGTSLRRPAFWDGERTWRVRFASPTSGGRWYWQTHGLSPETGFLDAIPSENRRGLLRMSVGGRNVVWSDGTGFYPVVDTAWAIPFRATLEQVRIWARDRQAKGFTAALLMTVQPDMKAEGPESRTEVGGFARAFDDLPKGRLTQLRPEYFHYLDRLIETLLSHGIVPIYQPVFHGFGWKGLSVAGLAVPPEDYARYCRYLVARYGSRPALWLPGADASGWEPNVGPAGEEIHRWDDYGQPTGLHYNPWQSSDAHWTAEWCDFHLCQTGHGGDHRPERVAVMHHRSPIRGVANGEPTYEGMGDGKHGLGDWQAQEAWENLVAGGTFGTFYGAASLWQWKLEGETEWDGWASGPWDWRAALDLPGSRFPGLVRKALEGMEWVDMAVRLDVARANRCVAVEGKFALVYLPTGGSTHLKVWTTGLPYRIMDALTGDWLTEGTVPEGTAFMGPYLDFPQGRPLVVVVGHRSGGA